jgi:hypothetical protein
MQFAVTPELGRREAALRLDARHLRRRARRGELEVRRVDARHGLATAHGRAGVHQPRHDLARHAERKARLVARADLAGVLDAARPAGHADLLDAHRAGFIGLLLRGLGAAGKKNDSDD